MRDRQPPPEEASFSLLSPPPPRLRSFKNNQHDGENAATKRGYYGAPAAATGPLAVPSARPSRRRHSPSRPALQHGPDGKPRARGGEGEAEGGRSEARCDALNGAISFRDPTEKVVLCST